MMTILWVIQRHFGRKLASDRFLGRFDNKSKLDNFDQSRKYSNITIVNMSQSGKFKTESPLNLISRQLPQLICDGNAIRAN